MLAKLPENEALETCARCLYGAAWHAPLAEGLGVSDRSLRRWTSLQAPIPAGIWEELRALLIAHSLEARDLAAQLPTAERSPQSTD